MNFHLCCYRTEKSGIQKIKQQHLQIIYRIQCEQVSLKTVKKKEKSAGPDATIDEKMWVFLEFEGNDPSSLTYMVERVP